MNSKPTLKLDWCSHDAAMFAVKHWHYSESLPPPPMVRVGVWEDAKFVGCVVFARGACSDLGTRYGLESTQVCELVRVALNKHKTPVSRILQIAVRMMQRQSPGVRLVVSYADPKQGHHGGIYQACNWVYSGKTSPDKSYIDANGKTWHSRMISAKGFKTVFGKQRKVLRPQDCRVLVLPGKHRYLLPLDAEMRKQVERLRQPYPKRVESAASGTSPVQGEGGGASPTSTLHLEAQNG